MGAATVPGKNNCWKHFFAEGFLFCFEISILHVASGKLTATMAMKKVVGDSRVVSNPFCAR